MALGGFSGNVRHVLKLRKNLISLGAYDWLGCMYMAKGGAMNISKCIWVIMKVQKMENLFKLVRNTVVGRVALSKLIEAIGESGMLELHKKNMLKGVRTCKLNFYKYFVYGKQHRVSFKISSHTLKGVLN